MEALDARREALAGGHSVRTADRKAGVAAAEDDAVEQVQVREQVHAARRD